MAARTLINKNLYLVKFFNCMPFLNVNPIIITNTNGKFSFFPPQKPLNSLENALAHILDDTSNEVGGGNTWSQRMFILPRGSFCGRTPWSNPNHLLEILPDREFINANIHVSIIVNQSMSWMTAALWKFS